QFEGKKDATLKLLAPPNTKLSLVLLVGTGKGKDFDAQAAAAWGGTAMAGLLGAHEANTTIMVDEVAGSPLALGELAAQVALGAKLKSYRFDKYRTKEKKEDKPA